MYLAVEHLQRRQKSFCYKESDFIRLRKNCSNNDSVSSDLLRNFTDYFKYTNVTLVVDVECFHCIRSLYRREHRLLKRYWKHTKCCRCIAEGKVFSSKPWSSIKLDFKALIPQTSNKKSKLGKHHVIKENLMRAPYSGL